MKNLVLILTIAFSTCLVHSYAQTDRKADKAAKKAMKAEQDSLNNLRLKTLVISKAFVLEANTLYSRSGMSFNLNSTTNFVGFDGKNSTIQLAFNQLVGWNGIGGVTLDGTISKMQLKENKKGLGFTINVTVQQKIGGAVTMIFRVTSDGNARVDMSGSYGERLSFQGRIVSLADTRVYKGTTLY